MDQRNIRNFCIIAHIDHGKSTLTDRLLEATGTITAREMEDQFMDQMDLEREKGITIKAKAVRLMYLAQDGEEYELNLIDTPGHVDFTYEVSRALAACEGAVLVVDASQGIEAQTLANLYMAIEHDLDIVPVVNKIDLPSARPHEVATEIDDLIGLPADHIILASAKEGIGTAEILEAVVSRISPPQGDPEAPLRALVFDSHYDPYKGVVAYVRVVDGKLDTTEPLLLVSENKLVEPLEVGFFTPKLKPATELTAGDVGYVATGLKNVRDCPVGDTITVASRPCAEALPGYKPAKPMVFAGIYPIQGEDYGLLRDALDKLRLNDVALVFEPETSLALHFGFRCGFLGLLHMEIVKERLQREYDLDLLTTVPSVEYQVRTIKGELLLVDNPDKLPPPEEIEEVQEPWMRLSIFTPSEYVGPIMDLVTSHRGVFDHMEYLDETRVLLTYYTPLAEIIIEFYDQLKSRTRGYASMDYTLVDYRPGVLDKLDILVNHEPVDAFSTIVPRATAYDRGKVLVEKLAELIPPHMFPIPIQAAIGGKIIARATVRAYRKNVLAKCYGGDITRKRKLLEKQKEGKKRMARFGQVEIPQEVFIEVLKAQD
ncbi:MAG: elongation factor 4 [Chloroflexi bacterium]|nr:elongation factor 4 [Chloroflexota bacterium]